MGLTRLELDYQIEKNHANRARMSETVNTTLTQFAAMLMAVEGVEEFKQLANRIENQSIKDAHQKPPSEKDNYIYFYHDSGHAKEMTHDIEAILGAYYKNKKIETTLATIVLRLAMTAGAGHDEVQGVSNPKSKLKNEMDSAESMAGKWIEELNKLKEILINKRGLKRPISEVEAAIANMKSVMQYVMDELIVAPTLLIFPDKKPLLSFTSTSEMRAEPDSPMQLLDAAKIAISYSDTHRNQLKSVLEEKVYLTMISKLDDAEAITAMKKLFSVLDMQTAFEKEGFLIRIHQNLRMFPEMNKFHHVLNNEDLAGLELSIAEARKSELKNFRDHFVKDSMLLFVSAFMEKAIPGEIEFSKGLAHSDHIEMAKNKGLEILLNKNNTQDNGWGSHAKHLDTFRSYYANLSAADKNIIAATLGYLAANQPGLAYLKRAQLQAGKLSGSYAVSQSELASNSTKEDLKGIVVSPKFKP